MKTQVVDKVIEEVRGNGDLPAGGRIGIESREGESPGVGATLTPLDPDRSLLGEHRSVVVIRPVGEPPVKS